jgi:hypothetical protein
MESKKCNQCKKIKVNNDFIEEHKTYSCCNNCRKLINEKRIKNICYTCGIRANFNYKDIRYGKFCKEHKEPGMVDVINKKCIEEGCPKTPVYNFQGQITRLYCKDHCKPGMINLKDKLCISCNKQASYNYEGETKAIYCKEHSKDNMILVKGHTCKEEGCLSRAMYNYPNNPAHYCKKHSKNGMIEIKKRILCLFEGCKILPSYNYKGEKSIYCAEHKLKDMILVRTKKCLLCDKQPTYNYPQEKVKLYCKEHSKEDMISLNKSNLCLSCDKVAIFNYENKKKPIYCKEHCENNMIDIIHKTCYKEDCKTRASYGYCGQSVSSCIKHKNEIMFKNPKRTCIGNDEEECKEIATYGLKEPTHCEEHSTKDEICLIGATCKGCYRTDELLNIEGLCFNFCSLTKLDNDNKKHQKLKEITMLKYLDEYARLPENIIKIQDNKIVDSFCNLYRPDRMYDCSTHIVLVECDEFQHKTKKICDSYRDLEHAELSRMHEIYNALGLPCIFLRWNPDNFRVNGMLNKKYNNRDRLKLLVKWIQHCFTMVPDKDISPVKYKYLFYDNFNETDISFLEIDDVNLV